MIPYRRAPRILIVDDAQLIHDCFVDALSFPHDADSDSAPRFRFSHAFSGPEAINLVECVVSVTEVSENGDSRSPGFAVAFIDLRLEPVFDGLATAAKIWEIDPLVQIVICTADERVNWRSLARSLSQSEQLMLLRKPLHPDELSQLAITLCYRWAMAVELNEKIRQLQHEIERRSQLEVELRRLVEQDALTKLPNRSILMDRINAILRAREQGIASIDAVLFMDLDNFKAINDSLGHQAGDEVLNQVANRLRKNVRLTDSQRPGRGEIVRLGGDEFVILLEQFNNRSDAIKVAERIVKRIAVPFSVGNHTVQIGSSVGVAFVDGEVTIPEQILRNADSAMYRAKLRGKSQVAVFGEESEITTYCLP